jgi:hypothetical protein
MFSKLMASSIDWLKDHLVPEATEWWRLWSARFLVVALTIDALSLSPVVGMLPEQVRAINPAVFDMVQLALVACALLSRFVAQPKIAEKMAAKVETRNDGTE